VQKECRGVREKAGVRRNGDFSTRVQSLARRARRGGEMRPEDFATCFADEAGPVLNEATRRHLYDAAEMVVDQIDEDLDNLRAALLRNHKFDVWSELNWTQDYLPKTYAASYDIGFVRQFYWTVVTVIFKVGSAWSPLASVAEELAMNALLGFAGTLRDLRRDAGEDVSEVEFDDLWDLAFWDLDFELLFAPEMDGIQHSEVGQQMRMVNLDRSQWFTQFDGAQVAPHPLTW